jgi:hypothetical protein
MKTLKPAIALALALAAGSAQANTITADGTFDVAFYPGDELALAALPETGTGSFSLRENRFAAFTFTMLGQTWTLEDVTPRRCPRYICSPDGDGQLDQILIRFDDGFLLWDFHQGIFSMDVLGLRGTSEGSSEGGQATGQFTSLTHRFQVPEPDTLTLLLLGLLFLRILTVYRKFIGNG